MQIEVMRQVYFFRLADYGEFHPLLEDSVKYIDSLPFNDQGRYLAMGDDDTVLALFVSSSTYPIRLQFSRIRRANLPMVEDAGKISPLKIAQSAGIIDWSHIVIFDDGTVAAEFNKDAPRIARLGEYLSFKTRGRLPSAPRFYPLFQRSIIEELEKFEFLTLLEVEALTSDSDSISEVNPDLGSAFAACKKAARVKKAKIILKSAREKDTDLITLAKRLFLNQKSRESLTVLKATGSSGDGRKPLDMLQEYLVCSENFIRVDKRTRALCPDHAFEALENAYLKKREVIHRAVRSNGPFDVLA